MNIIKRKALSVLESSLVKQGTILDVREWNPATFFEIDLHMPKANMEKWSTVQHIKVKVADYTYRGALSFLKESHCKEFSDYFGTGIQTILDKSWDFSLVSWLEKQQLANETVYIAGHTPTAVALRKYLRQCADFKGQFCCTDFGVKKDPRISEIFFNFIEVLNPWEHSLCPFTN